MQTKEDAVLQARRYAMLLTPLGPTSRQSIVALSARCLRLPHAACLRIAAAAGEKHGKGPVAGCSAGPVLGWKLLSWTSPSMASTILFRALQLRRAICLLWIHLGPACAFWVLTRVCTASSRGISFIAPTAVPQESEPIPSSQKEFAPRHSPHQ